jgi:hypothetical protein
MKRKDIAIIVAAQNIPKETINRFNTCIRSSNTKYSYDIKIGSSDEPVFYKTKILNRLLRECFDHYQVIIQTDIDLIIPPGLINKTFESVVNGKHTAYHHSLRYIDPKLIQDLLYKNYSFSEWVQLPSTFCSGCWNGMSCTTWKNTRGYNEKMFAWGYEDTEFFNGCDLPIKEVNC